MVSKVERICKGARPVDPEILRHVLAGLMFALKTGLLDKKDGSDVNAASAAGVVAWALGVSRDDVKFEGLPDFSNLAGSLVKLTEENSAVGGCRE